MPILTWLPTLKFYYCIKISSNESMTISALRSNREITSICPSVWSKTNIYGEVAGRGALHSWRAYWRRCIVFPISISGAFGSFHKFKNLNLILLISESQWSIRENWCEILDFGAFVSWILLFEWQVVPLKEISTRWLVYFHTHPDTDIYT